MSAEVMYAIALCLVLVACKPTPPPTHTVEVEASCVTQHSTKEHVRCMELLIIAEADLRQCRNRLTQLGQ